MRANEPSQAPVGDLADVEAGDLHARLLDEAGGVVEDAPDAIALAAAACPLATKRKPKKPSSAMSERGDADLDRRRGRLHRTGALGRVVFVVAVASLASCARRSGRCPTSRRTRARTGSLQRLNLVGRAAHRRSCPRRASRCDRAMRKVDAMSWLMTTLVTPVSLRDVADHVVDVLGRDRIEARRRLIVQQNLRLQDERARQADALAHAARELGGKLLLDVAQPERAAAASITSSRISALRLLGVLDEREGHVLLDGKRIEQRRSTETSMPNLRRTRLSSIVVERHDVLAVDPDVAAVGLEQAHEVLHQHRLALPRAADDDVDLAALDVEIDAAQHLVRAERLLDAANADLVRAPTSALVVVGRAIICAAAPG